MTYGYARHLKIRKISLLTGKKTRAFFLWLLITYKGVLGDACSLATGEPIGLVEDPELEEVLDVYFIHYGKCAYRAKMKRSLLPEMDA